MLKVYEWLVYIFKRPHKSFQHLIKWFGIFLSEPKQIQKKKGKIKQKRIRKTLPVAQAKPAQPAHPAHQGQGGLLPPPAPPSCSVECHRASRAAATPPACLEPSPRHLLTPGDAQELPRSIPPLQSSPPLSPARVRRRPKLHRSAPPWTTWPPCTRAQASKSIVLLALDFVIKQKLEP